MWRDVVESSGLTIDESRDDLKRCRDEVMAGMRVPVYMRDEPRLSQQARAARKMSGKSGMRASLGSPLLPNLFSATLPH